MLLACWISHVSYVSSTCTSTCWILLVHAVIKRTSTICNRYTILYNPIVFNLFLASGAEQFCKSLCVDLELDQDDCRISIQDFNQSGVSTLKQKQTVVEEDLDEEEEDDDRRLGFVCACCDACPYVSMTYIVSCSRCMYIYMYIYNWLSCF
jgi:hypothetical protein